MTSSTKKRTAPSKPARTKSSPALGKVPLPDSADRAVIGGTEFIIIPSGDFAEWYEDQILATVAAERLKLEHAKAMPAAEVFSRLKRSRKTK